MTSDALHEQGQSKHLTGFEANMRRLMGFARDRSLLEALQNESDRESLVKLSALLVQYHEQFRALVKAYRVRGYKKRGLLGELAAAETDVDAALASFTGADSLWVERLALQASVKEFLARREQHSAETIFENLKRQLGPIGIVILSQRPARGQAPV